MNAHQIIVNNLEGRVHGMNAFAATAGTDLTEGSVALRELISIGRVRVETITGPRGERVPLYRLNHFHSNLKLVVDNPVKGS